MNADERRHVFSPRSAHHDGKRACGVSATAAASAIRIQPRSAAFVCGYLFCLVLALTVHAAERPNIVFILADDLGYADINCFDPLERGYYRTPHIDRLATQGVKFTQAYTNAANCSPTRAALLSGQYYPRQPVYHVGNPSNPKSGKLIPAPNTHHLPAEKRTLAEALKPAGYATAFIGKWHIGKGDTGPIAQGFDVNVGGYSAGNPNGWKGGYFAPNNNPHISDARDGEYLTDYLTRKAVEYIEANRDKPFYLQLSYYTPHTPLQAPKERIAPYRKREGKGGHDNATYAAMLESLDLGVGAIMQTLDRLGIAERTIVVFYSDNGGSGSFKDIGRRDNGITDNSPLKSGKGSFYEGGIRVPLIVRWPQRIKPGGVCDEPVIGIDFYPTFLEAAGIVISAFDYPLDGVSIMPLLKDPSATLDRDAMYWHFPGYPNAAWRTTPVSVLRSGDWKLMKFYAGPTVELYNLKDDLSESRNVAGEHPDVRDRLQKRLEKWLTDNDAPMPKRKQHPTGSSSRKE